MNKYIVLKPHCKPRIVTLDNVPRCITYEQWNAFKSLSTPPIDYLEVVSVLDSFVLLIDEEGKMKDNWKVNECASFLYGALPYDFIVNTAVLVARDEFEPGELRFLSDDEAKYICRLLSSSLNREPRRETK